MTLIKVRETERGLEMDDIKIEYHPNSGKNSIIYRFEDYRRQKSSHYIPLDEEPWRPFACRTDFEFARIAMEAALKPELRRGTALSFS